MFSVVAAEVVAQIVEVVVEAAARVCRVNERPHEEEAVVVEEEE